MKSYKQHLIPCHVDIKSALVRLNQLGRDAILFVVDKENKLIGSLTDGDVRRALINGATIDQDVNRVLHTSPKFIRKGENDIEKVIAFREGNFRILPILDDGDRVVNVVNFDAMRSYLPLDAVIMAGGRGQRLRPLTDSTPKPLLKVGNKPIMEHNVDRLTMYGIDDFWISVRYLGEQIIDYFQDGSLKNINIEYVWEDEPLGTIGAVSKISNFKHDYILVTNSDLLTNLDYEHFFLDFISRNADMSIATVPYTVNIPYAVLETTDNKVTAFKEKPTYTFYSNAGIYLIKKSVLEMIPMAKHFNATDLMDLLLESGFNVTSYALLDYWLDVGKPEDYKKAQSDIQQIKF